MASTAKNKRIAEKLEKQMGTAEPTAINPLNYKIELLNAMNTYNLVFDNKTKRKWTLEYLKKNDPTMIPKIDKVKDYEFRTVGALIRMKTRNIFLEDNELAKIDLILTELVIKQENMPEEEEEEKQAKPKVDKNKEKITEIYATLDYAIDDFLLKDEPLPDVQSVLKAADAPRSISSVITEFKKNLVEEISLAIDGKDEDINDAYSYTTKSKLKKLKSWMEQVVQDIHSYANVVKVRAKRVSKPKSPIVLVKNLKYKTDFPELNLKSVAATSIIGASIVWLYDTKSRRLSVYSGDNITVKGTSLMNYDPDKSTGRILRKPEFLKTFMELPKKSMQTEYSKLTTTESKGNGRMNENMIILKVF